MWHTPSELISSVIISLSEEVVNNPQIGWTRNYRDSSVENEIEIGRRGRTIVKNIMRDQPSD